MKNEFLKTYDIDILVKSPLHIGSGQMINKKEYIYDKNTKMIYIPNLYKMYDEISKRGLEKSYKTFLLDFKQDDLYMWLLQEKFSQKDFEAFTAYKYDASRIIFEKKMKGIVAMVKDAYGKPYIPGSSIKGALRTAILSSMIMDSKSKDDATYIEIEYNKIDRQSKGKWEKSNLGSVAKKIESKYINTLNREGTKPSDAVNSIMSGLIIADTESVGTDCLMLGQKYDISIDGERNRIPIMRECIKPDTILHGRISIDSTKFPYDIDYIRFAIRLALRKFNENNNKKYYNRFGKDICNKENEIQLGGGVGYVNKTIVYSVFDLQKALNITSGILDKQFPKIKTRHIADKRLGASPRVVKCTMYDNKLYDMGICSIKIK